MNLLCSSLPLSIERCAAGKSSLLGLCVRGQFRNLYKISEGRKLLDRLRKERELDLFRRKIITIPNVLTLSRLAAAPLFPWLISSEQPVYAFGLLMYCGITDMVINLRI
jgi:hypothetical protein